MIGSTSWLQISKVRMIVEAARSVDAGANPVRDRIAGRGDRHLDVQVVRRRWGSF